MIAAVLKVTVAAAPAHAAPRFAPAASETPNTPQDPTRTLVHRFDESAEGAELRVFVDEDGRGNVEFQAAGPRTADNKPLRFLENVRIRTAFQRQAISSLGLDAGYEAAAFAKIVAVGTDDGIYVFSSSGRFEQVPFSVRPAEARTGIFRIAASSLELQVPVSTPNAKPGALKAAIHSKAQQFLALSLYASVGESQGADEATQSKMGTPSQDTTTSQTYVFREDLRWTRVAYDFVDLNKHPITSTSFHRGLLLLREDFRAIDLFAFDGETRFNPLPPLTVTEGTDKEGKPLRVDPVAAADDAFGGDMLGDIVHDESVFDEVDDAVIDQIRTVTFRKESGNPVLLGSTGVGKQSLLKAFFKRIRLGHYPDIPRTLRVYDLSSGAMEADTRWAGQLAKKIRVLSAAAREVPIWLYLGNLHAQRGKGTHSGDHNDYLQQLLPLLTSGRVRIVAWDTPEEFLRTIKGDQNLGRLFTGVTMEAPPSDQVLQRAKQWLAHHDFVPPSDRDLELARKYSDRMIAVGSQPAKIITLLEDTYARMAIRRPQEFGVQGATREDIEEVLQNQYGASPAIFSKERAERNLANYDAVMEGRLAGAHEIKRVGRELVGQWYKGVNDPKKPAVSILYTGKKGTGKTEYGRALGEALELPVSVIEMNQFDGNDPNATPKKFLRQVAQELQKHAFCVIVLDEYEKATPAVKLAVLSMLETGTFTVDLAMGSGFDQETRPEIVQARDVVFLLTSNAGSRYVMQQSVPKPRLGFVTDKNASTAAPADAQKLTAFETALVADGIPDTTFDRVQAVVAAVPPTRAEFREVLKRHALRAVQEQRQRWGVAEIVFEDFDAWLDQMVESKYHEEISNRVAIRAVTDNIRAALARVPESQKGNSEIQIRMRLLDRSQADLSGYSSNGLGQDCEGALEK